MNVSPKQDKRYHEILPIDPDEKVLAVYRHHVFAYILPMLTAALVVLVLMGLAVLLSSQTNLNGEPMIATDYQKYAYGTALVLSIATITFTFVPVWLRLQEHIVLTDEAILQMLQPALFASKVSQTSLDHIADVSVRQDFLGTIMGYGKLTVETPGEQNNYEYMYLPNPREAAREIIETQENFVAALQSGNLPSKFGTNASNRTTSQPKSVSVDTEEYRAFQQFQQQQEESDDNHTPAQPPSDTSA
jgi:uncharacterized membrane protein YdbT with pleckstrin-like domain